MSGLARHPAMPAPDTAAGYVWGTGEPVAALRTATQRCLPMKVQAVTV